MELVLAQTGLESCLSAAALSQASCVAEGDDPNGKIETSRPPTAGQAVPAELCHEEPVWGHCS